MNTAQGIHKLRSLPWKNAIAIPPPRFLYAPQRNCDERKNSRDEQSRKSVRSKNDENRVKPIPGLARASARIYLSFLVNKPARSTHYGNYRRAGLGNEL
jgi:hypothetical protein